MKTGIVMVNSIYLSVGHVLTRLTHNNEHSA